MRLIRPLLTIAVVFGVARGADLIPATAAIPDPTAFAVVYVPDLAKAIDRIEAFSVAVNPQTPKGMMKMGLGMTLGDPQLANLGKGPTAIIVTPGMPMPGFAIVLPAVKPELFATALGQNGMMTKVVGSNVIISQLPDGLDVGERVAGQLATIGANPLKGDLRALVALDRVMTNYGSFLTGMVGMMSMQGGKQPGMEMIPAYVAGLQIVSADIQMLQIDVSFGADALAITSTVAAKPGSELAKALIAPTVVAKAPARLGDAKGLAVMTARINQQALAGYVMHVLTALQQRPDTKKLITPEFMNMMKLQGEATNGDTAARFQSSDQTPISMQMIAGTADEKKSAAAVQAQADLFKSGTTLGTMYKNMGMTCSMNPEARKVGSVVVGRSTWTLDASKMPPAQAESMKRVMMDTEMAFTDGFSFASMGAPIDSLLTGGGKAPVLAATTTFGADRHAYVDADLNGFATMIAGFVPNGKDFADIVKKLPPLPPITAAGTIADGRSRGEISIPVKAIAELTKLSSAGGKPRQHRNHDDQQAPPKRLHRRSDPLVFQQVSNLAPVKDRREVV